MDVHLLFDKRFSLIRLPARRIFAARGLRGSVLLVLALVSLMGSACLVPDLGPPEPPILDWREKITSAATVKLSGYAEPGSRLEVERVPPFEEEDAPEAVEIVQGGRFSIELPLATNRMNVFTLRVVDFDGRPSAPVRAHVTHERLRLAEVELLLPSERFPVGDSGRTSIPVSARVQANDPEASLKRFELEFRLLSAGQIVASDTVQLNEEGLASTVLEAELKAGNIRVEVEPTGQFLAENDLLDFRQIEILPGSPRHAVLELAELDGSFDTGQRSVVAGSELRARMRVEDAAGNTVHLPWNLKAEPEEAALVVGDKVIVKKAGSLMLRGQVLSERPLSANGIRVTVHAAGAPDRGDASLLTLKVDAPDSVVAGESLSYSAKLVDPWENPVSIKELVVNTTSAGATVMGIARRVILQEAGETTLHFEADRGDGSWITAEHQVEVFPAEPDELELLIDGQSSDPDKPVSLEVGSVVSAQVRAVDAFANPVSSDISSALSFSLPSGWATEGGWLLAPGTAGEHELLVELKPVGGGKTLQAEAFVKLLPGPLSNVLLECPQSVTAGESFSCETELSDKFGNPVEEELSWGLLPEAGSSEVDGVLQSQLAGTLEVQLLAGDLKRTALVEVLPAAPSELRLKLEPEVVVAGEPVTLEMGSYDKFGNPTGHKLKVSTDAPDAVLHFDSLHGLSAVGQYTVSVELENQGSAPSLSANASLRVEAAEPAQILFLLEKMETERGQPVAIELAIADRFGNIRDGEPELSANGGPLAESGIARFGDSLIFEQTGSFTLKAELAAGIKPQDPEPVVRQILVHLEEDSQAPELQVVLLREGSSGDEEGGDSGVSGPVFRPGEALWLLVHASDNRQIKRIGAAASGVALVAPVDEDIGPELPIDHWSHSFLLPLRDDGLGRVDWSVTAEDSAGLTTTVDGFFEVDVHHHRWSSVGGAAALVRTLSLDSELRNPRWLSAVEDEQGEAQIFVAQESSAESSGSIGFFGKHGELDPLWPLSPDPRGLTVLQGTSGWTLWTGSEDEVGMRPELLIQDESVRAAWSSGFPDLEGEPGRIGDLSLSSDGNGLVVAELPQGDLIRGRLWILPADEAFIDFDSETFASSDLTDLRPEFLCAGDFDDLLTFSAVREGDLGKLWTGIYQLPITEHGFDGTPLTLFEEETQPESELRVGFAGCAVAGGDVYVARNSFESEEDSALELVRSSVFQLPLSCESSCSPTTVAASLEPEPSPLASMAVLHDEQSIRIWLAQPESGEVFSIVLEP